MMVNAPYTASPYCFMQYLLAGAARIELTITESKSVALTARLHPYVNSNTIGLPVRPTVGGFATLDWIDPVLC